MSLRRLPALFLLLFVPSSASSDWAFMSQHEKLEGHVISYVGEASQKSKYLPDTFENLEWYEFKRGVAMQFCFRFSRLVGLWGLDDTSQTPPGLGVRALRVRIQ